MGGVFLCPAPGWAGGNREGWDGGLRLPGPCLASGGKHRQGVHRGAGWGPKTPGGGGFVRTGPQYLEGWMGNEAVEVTNRGGDIHRHGPLLLSWRAGRRWWGHDWGRFLEKSAGEPSVPASPHQPPRLPSCRILFSLLSPITTNLQHQVLQAACSSHRSAAGRGRTHIFAFFRLSCFALVVTPTQIQRLQQTAEAEQPRSWGRVI